jgi:hypothetical protein
MTTGKIKYTLLAAYSGNSNIVMNGGYFYYH